jgi:hypothetical protein
VNESILTGNFFTCSLDHHQLPLQDPGYEEYACGANFLEGIMISIVCIFAVLILVTSICWFVAKGVFGDILSHQKEFADKVFKVRRKAEVYLSKKAIISALSYKFFIIRYRAMKTMSWMTAKASNTN